ncbi:Friend leukemia integration 1 transcription factor [Exaiptasia diaphana]|uniref:PNT domain-containing protein n=1 Tax=Exaiptasia diaphana TaxID=2652724 RepID=A0A913XQ76_EXADI|nr:Friend leukemia integration 1 transcription factor [Exaiptasia diaphana]KXJ25205.1 Transcription factor ETV6 [Exaiptasia diaphana]
MYPRQEYQPFKNQYPNGYYNTGLDNNFQVNPVSQDPKIAWSNQQQPQALHHKMVYPTDMNPANNSRIDPTLAYPVAIRPSSFEHGRFIDKMQPGFPRVKTEKYFESPYPEDTVPLVDPRLWSREDVARWLQWVSDAYSLHDIKPDRFEMNGKGLCLMTLDMFLYRVPEGGRVLYHDFQRRLRIAVGS